ncbi:MAG: hypothetical protein KJO54_13930 [Gammaproteobacteria bacterium]|nr:hypothetical protein [Gammaproteobacteria bacterium]NNF60150.1 hypothetical protein [Gammaproteobacteria bacterium]NNM21562.1 hypothetical protein [Gammaproteobacteria bacterium]
MKNLLFVVLFTLVITACSKKDEDLEDAAARMAHDAKEKVGDVISEEPPKNLEEALKRVGDALGDGEQSVSAADLKTLLPEEIAGMKRTSYEAERAGIGIKVSKAHAEYADGDRRASLMITDLGAVSGLARMGMELFETELDSEDENGFERTTEYKGHKSFQRLQRSGDQSIAEIMVFVSDRFTVHLDGQNIGFDELLESMDKIDIGKLTAMKAPAAAE